MQGYLFGVSSLLFVGVFNWCEGGDVIPDHRCPTGWDNHLTRCYWYLDGPAQKTTWADANQNCQDIGGYLYVPSDDDEGAYVQDALEKRESFASISQGIWIGCHDQEVNERYDCFEDNGYRNWADGEPNDIWEEDCISVYTSRPNNSLWNDKDCLEPYNAVCERAGTNLYSITRRFEMSSDISGGTSRVLLDHCLVELPDLQPEGFTVSSLIRCAVSCVVDSECEAFNFLRHNAVLSSSSSSPSPSSSSLSSPTSSRLPGTCQKLYNLKNVTEDFTMTQIDGCSFYELN